MVKRERECNGEGRENEEGRSGNYKLLSEKAQTCTLYVGIRVGGLMIVGWPTSI